MSKIWFITGSSRGFGRQFAQAALEWGDKVAATARTTDSLADLVTAHGEAILPLTLDVTDKAAATEAVQRVHDHRSGTPGGIRPPDRGGARRPSRRRAALGGTAPGVRRHHADERGSARAGAQLSAHAPGDLVTARPALREATALAGTAGAGDRPAAGGQP